MQLVTPRVVAMAVSTDTITCSMSFQLLFSIVVFLLSCYIIGVITVVVVRKPGRSKPPEHFLRPMFPYQLVVLPPLRLLCQTAAKLCVAIGYRVDRIPRELLRVSFTGEHCRAQRTGGSGAQAHSRDVFRGSETACTVGRLGGQSAGEYGQVVKLYVLAVEHQLLDTRDSILEHSGYHSGRIGRTVRRHVGGELVGIYSLVAHRSCVILSCS